jgi:hypothetical protein
MSARANLYVERNNRPAIERLSVKEKSICVVSIAARIFRMRVTMLIPSIKTDANPGIKTRKRVSYGSISYFQIYLGEQCRQGRHGRLRW